MNSSKFEDLKSDIPLHILPVYMLWLEGKTVKQIKEVLGGGKRTESADKRYYRASKYLKDEHSINIKVRLTNSDIEKDHVSSVVPLVSVLRSGASKPPEWFFDKGLIYTPSNHGLYKEG